MMRPESSPVSTPAQNARCRTDAGGETSRMAALPLGSECLDVHVVDVDIRLSCIPTRRQFDHQRLMEIVPDAANRRLDRREELRTAGIRKLHHGPTPRPEDWWAPSLRSTRT